MSGAPRHQWTKAEEHHYDCARCGVHKENVQLGERTWRMKFTWPDGREETTSRTPACADLDAPVATEEDIPAPRQ